MTRFLRLVPLAAACLASGCHWLLPVGSPGADLSVPDRPQVIEASADAARDLRCLPSCAERRCCGSLRCGCPSWTSCNLDAGTCSLCIPVIEQRGDTRVAHTVAAESGACLPSCGVWLKEAAGVTKMDLGGMKLCNCPNGCNGLGTQLTHDCNFSGGWCCAPADGGRPACK